ncbi:MAG: phenylalanine--tRNA ligase subunit beta, partial [Phycisphaerae bacterium]
MLISLNWLSDYVDLPADGDPRRLAERLTLTTAEVESVEQVRWLPPEVVVPAGTSVPAELLNDWIIEIDNKSITHRPDLWGHYGIAREVAAILGRPLKPLPQAELAELSPKGLPEIAITIDDSTQCPRYSGLRMRAIGAQPAPLWMQVRLARVGMRPINLLVDLTNYVMAELGQPMHAFDAAGLACIEVAQAAKGERFRTLDGVERVMPAGTLMIQSRRKSVAIAGIMGGAATEISPSTKEMLLESANFDPATIRRAATVMGCRTEASARFEKSLDPNLTVSAIARFVHLARQELSDLTLTSKLSDCYPAPLEIPRITLDPAHVARMIGQPTSRARIISILKPLEFDVREDGAALHVTPPTFRATKDVAIEEDLLEEVARFVGYDHITPELPRVQARPLDAAADRVVERRSLEMLCLGGPFIEVHGYVWDDDDWLGRIGYEPGPRPTLRNPVAPHTAGLRRSLLPGLLAVCERNRHRVQAFELIEVGSVFPAGEGDVVERQQRHLGLAVVRPGRKAEDDVWGAIKAWLERWAEQVARTPLTFDECEAEAPWEDARRCCTLAHGGRTVGRASIVPMALRLKIDERLRTLAIGLAEVSL